MSKMVIDRSRQPRLHGNGFIQLDLDDTGTTRLNVWDPDLLPLSQKTRTPIHDHRFSFVSEIIYGEQVHIEYTLREGSGYKLYTPQRRPGTEDTKLVPFLQKSNSFDLIAHPTQRIERGSQYQFGLGRFHESNPTGLTATIMTKTRTQVNWIVAVACLSDEEPDNEFDRDVSVDPELLWMSIDRVIELVNAGK